MNYLTLQDVVYINEVVVDVFGGSLGIRDLGLIDSAVNRPRASFLGRDLYVSLFDKTAALFHSLVMNHAFFDGNKRTAITSAAQFLYINDFELIVNEQELENFTVRIVEEKLDVEKIAIWLEKNSKKSRA